MMLPHEIQGAEQQNGIWKGRQRPSPAKILSHAWKPGLHSVGGGEASEGLGQKQNQCWWEPEHGYGSNDDGERMQ